MTAASLALMAATVALACRGATAPEPQATQTPRSSQKASKTVPAAKAPNELATPSAAATIVKSGAKNSDDALTSDQVRALLVGTYLLFDRIVTESYAKLGPSPKPRGVCSDGEPALPVVKAAEVMPEFQKRLEGRALKCYLATYFRCRVDGWLAHAANLVTVGLPNVPFNESKVTIRKQTTNLVVADVVEAEPVDLLPDGSLDKEQVSDGNFNSKARYTLSRAKDGIWRIADRVPNNGPMDCQQY
jgi:hypothetical protein